MRVACVSEGLGDGGEIRVPIPRPVIATRAEASTRGASFSWGDKLVPFDEALHDFEVVRRVQREALEQIRPGMSHYDARNISDDSDIQMTNDE